MPKNEVVTPQSVQNDPSKRLGINVVGGSPHVFVYRFWVKRPSDNQWTILKDGNTEDEIPDFFLEGSFPDHTQIAWWIGIGGKPNTNFTCTVIFTQEGKVVLGGVIDSLGRTSAKGGAESEKAVVLI